jgi:hypothetical protein
MGKWMVVNIVFLILELIILVFSICVGAWLVALSMLCLIIPIVLRFYMHYRNQQ